MGQRFWQYIYLLILLCACPACAQVLGSEGINFSRGGAVGDGVQVPRCVHSPGEASSLTMSGLTIQQNDTVMVGIYVTPDLTVSVHDNGGSVYSRRVGSIENILPIETMEIESTGAHAAKAASTLTVTTSSIGAIIVCVHTYRGVQQFGHTYISFKNGSPSATMFVSSSSVRSRAFSLVGAFVNATSVATKGRKLASAAMTSPSPFHAGIYDNVTDLPLPNNIMTDTVLTPWAQWSGAIVELIP